MAGGVPATPRSGSDPLVVRLPDRSQVNLAAAETNFSGTTMPGIYTVASPQPARRFAVNLDPAESRTMPLPPEELVRFGAPVAHPITAVVREAVGLVLVILSDLV